MPRTFGYTPERAEAKKNALDLCLSSIENRVRQIAGAVPGAETITSRLAAAAEEIREVVGDLQELIDERTDTEAAA